MKPRNWQITEALIEVLKEFDCSLEEARNLLQDAASDFESHLEARSEAYWSERSEPDDSAARRDIIAAGRGHLLR